MSSSIAAKPQIKIFMPNLTFKKDRYVDPKLKEYLFFNRDVKADTTLPVKVTYTNQTTERRDDYTFKELRNVAIDPDFYSGLTAVNLVDDAKVYQAYKLAPVFAKNPVTKKIPKKFATLNLLNLQAPTAKEPLLSQLPGYIAPDSPTLPLSPTTPTKKDLF